MLYKIFHSNSIFQKQNWKILNTLEFAISSGKLDQGHTKGCRQKSSLQKFSIVLAFQPQTEHQNHLQKTLYGTFPFHEKN